MSKITPVILAGGHGSRLWPLSRSSYPKQFSKIISDKSLFQSTAMRCTSSESLEFMPPITMTNAAFRFIVAEQLQEIGIDPGPILIEPSVQNTAPSILAASLYAHKQDSESILLVTPSDHVVPNDKAFHHAISKGLDPIKDNKIVTFGIAPTRPETGYGYLECAQTIDDKAVAVTRFIEKPNFKTAKNMFRSENLLWNAGIFLFRAKDIIQAFHLNAKELIEPTSKALEAAKSDLGFLRLNAAAWKATANISIDYAVMERAKNLMAVPYSAGWTDLGGWDAVWQEQGPDQHGLVVSENATAIDCNNCLIRSEDSSQHIVGLGLDNIIAIAMPDAVLVANKSRSQDVRKIVPALKAKGIPQAEISSKDHRPWGWFETLIIQKSFRVKRIFVKSGGALSLQSHKYRSEHWIVVEGKAKVTIDKKIAVLGPSESIYVPQGAIHRLENLEEKPMELIEIQTGSYLGEDDIVRYEDLYARLADD